MSEQPSDPPKSGHRTGSHRPASGRRRLRDRLTLPRLRPLLSPLAAILPFVDPGLADDANCGALLAEARQAGAPVKASGR